MTYDTQAEAQLLMPAGARQYNVQISGLHAMPGIFVPSHRPPVHYQPVQSIPANFSTGDFLFQQYLNEMRARFSGGHTGYTPTYRLKEALMALAAFGPGSDAVDRNEEFVETYNGFISRLKAVLPKSLGFQTIRVRPPEVIVETSGGEFPLDSVSGGIAAIIDLAWQLHMTARQHDQFIVVIDEPENHLHPELQRTLFPTFLSAFPTVQFVTATHNPFIVGSTPESSVYVLTYDEEGLVRSMALDDVDKAGSSNVILREGLGLDSTVPYWVEQRLSDIRGRFEHRPLNDEFITALRNELGELGMADLFPETLSELLRDRR